MKKRILLLLSICCLTIFGLTACTTTDKTKVPDGNTVNENNTTPNTNTNTNTGKEDVVDGVNDDVKDDVVDDVDNTVTDKDKVVEDTNNTKK